MAQQAAIEGLGESEEEGAQACFRAMLPCQLPPALSALTQVQRRTQQCYCQLAFSGILGLSSGILEITLPVLVATYNRTVLGGITRADKDKVTSAGRLSVMYCRSQASGRLRNKEILGYSM